MDTRKIFIFILLLCFASVYGCAMVNSFVHKPDGSVKTESPGNDSEVSSTTLPPSPKGENPILDEIFSMATDAVNGDNSGECREILSEEDVERFSQPTIDHTLSALRNLTRGAELTFEAAELSKEAERMKLIRAKIDPKLANDPEAFKEVLEEVNDAITGKLSELDYETVFDTSKGRKNISKTLLHFGIAGYFDTRAHASAGNFLKCTTNTVEKMTEDPTTMLKQRDLIATVKNYMEITKLVTTNVYNQTKQVIFISGNLVSYAQKHAIEMPDRDDLEEELQKNEPEYGDDLRK